MTAVAPLTIALLEDDDVLRERVLLPRLADYGFQAHGLGTVEALMALLATQLPDIVVLDVGLTDGDGYEVTRLLRGRHPEMGIVMLTARGETPDRVRGLSHGADAYLAKPVEMELLAATLHSLARRLATRLPAPAQEAGRWRLEAQGWSLVTPAGVDVALTKAERRLLAALAAAHGEAVAREQLMGALSANVHDFDPHRLESLVHRLRRKVEQTSGESLPLATVHGEGYVLTSFG